MEIYNECPNIYVTTEKGKREDKHGKARAHSPVLAKIDPPLSHSNC